MEKRQKTKTKMQIANCKKTYKRRIEKTEKKSQKIVKWCGDRLRSAARINKNCSMQHGKKTKNKNQNVNCKLQKII